MKNPMHAPSLYLDTSVIGGYFDPEFMADTRALWKLREAGLFRFISSDLVVDEIAGSVNLLQGYRPLRIVAPTFLIHGHQEI